MLLPVHAGTAAVAAFLTKVSDWGLATCIASHQTGCWLLHVHFFFLIFKPRTISYLKRRWWSDPECSWLLSSQCHWLEKQTSHSGVCYTLKIASYSSHKSEIWCHQQRKRNYCFIYYTPN